MGFIKEERQEKEERQKPKGKHREGRQCLSYRVNDGEKQREIMVEAMESEEEINVTGEDRGRE